MGYLAENMDLDNLGTLYVSERDGFFFIMDGQHRFEALKRYLGDGWEGSYIQCFVAVGLTEQEEAEIFLGLADVLSVGVMQKFRISLTAGRPEEVTINEIASQQGLHISAQRAPNSVRCIGQLKTVFRLIGADGLARTLRLAHNGLGDPGMETNIIGGVSLLCHRYNGTLSDDVVVRALRSMAGGANALLARAEQLKMQTGNQKAHCVAAAMVDVVNVELRGARKLPGWWKN